MSKRTSFTHQSTNPKDFWATPPDAVLPLLNYFTAPVTFIEPCAGDGALRDTLQARGHKCAAAYDIHPRGDKIVQRDALKVTTTAPYCVTNPPYTESLVVPLIRYWVRQPQTTYLLIPSDWLANLWFGEFAPRVFHLIPVGRIKWISNSPSSGFENSMWVGFNRDDHAFLSPRIDKRLLRRLDRERSGHGLLD